MCVCMYVCMYVCICVLSRDIYTDSRLRVERQSSKNCAMHLILKGVSGRNTCGCTKSVMKFTFNYHLECTRKWNPLHKPLWKCNSANEPIWSCSVGEMWVSLKRCFPWGGAQGLQAVYWSVWRLQDHICFLWHRVKTAKLFHSFPPH